MLSSCWSYCAVQGVHAHSPVQSVYHAHVSLLWFCPLWCQLHCATHRVVLQGVDFKTLFPDANEQALDLMQKMLKFDPADRIDVNAALEHPWLAQLHDCTAEPVCPKPIVFGFEDENLTGEQVRDRLYKEIRKHFHPDLA